MLHLSAFEHFSSETKNKSLVNKGLFGVLVLKDNEWHPTEIVEEDFVRYTHVVDSTYESEEIQIKLEHEAYRLGNSMAPMWPLVRKIEW
jgi:hypothetical protein